MSLLNTDEWMRSVDVPVYAGNGEGAPRPRGVPQTLQFRNGIPFQTVTNRATAPPGPTAPWDKHDPRWGTNRPSTASNAPAAVPTRKPSWLAYDGVKLQWRGYFEDLETTKRTGLPRVRKCFITYHLEDGTVDVREPREVNSGIVQGPLLHRMPCDNANGERMSFRDIRVGEPVAIFSRTYNVLGCDEFTRAFLAKEGVHVPPEIPFPHERDPEPPKGQFKSAPSVMPAAFGAPPRLPDASSVGGVSVRFNSDGVAVEVPTDHDDDARGSTGVRPAPPSAIAGLKEAAGRQFLAYDRRVLRFFGTCEVPAGGDDARLVGSTRNFVVHYYLADDTVEVLEVMPGNAGREPYGKFLKRQKLPKATLAGGGYRYGVGIRPASDETLRARRREPDGSYHWRDFRVGEDVVVFGLVLTLRDCDEHTKAWYATECGLTDDDFPSMPPPAGPPPIPKMIVPPNVSGIGSEADSLNSVYRLVPKVPKKDVSFDEWLINQGQVMRFTGTLVDGPGKPPVPENEKSRTFVVSFFLEDNTLAVFEPPVANSGYPGGKYLERRPARKTSGSNVYLRARDCHVGAVLEIKGTWMRLNAADDATLAIMEARPKEFPGSDARAVVTALTQALARSGSTAAKELSRLCAVEDAKLGGGGAMVLNRAAFLNVMCELCAHAPGLGEFVDAQRLITLWRVLPKVSFDPSQTRLPAGVPREALGEDHALIADVFETLSVPFER